MNRFLLWSLLAVPLIAIGLQFAGSRPKAVGVLSTPLRERVANVLPGWTAKDRPIAESDEMKKSVGELLNFDDALYRSYRRGTQSIDLYVAYWRPGKMSYRLVAAHTPDVCWVGDGWTLLEHESRTISILKGTPLATAQYRVFEFEGARQTVLFWHLSGGQLISYDRVGTPPWWAPIRDLRRNGLDQRQQQYFIRVSSPLPIEQWQNDPDFKALLSSLVEIAK